ncbi:MAG: hypothetical protein J6K45_05420 [Clostridia bacterium]|nr:hypothetical protein [Clostridia bacterium]
MKSLTNIIIKNSKRQEIQETLKEKILSFIAFIIVFGFLTVTMISISYTVTYKLKEINQTYTFINILLLMNFIILFAKSVFESLNVLYFSKDLKQLLKMPIKPKDIVHAKLINMIISEYQMEIIMLAIPMIIYGIIMRVKILFYLYILITLIILPIIPIITTSIITAIIMRFSNKLKNKAQVMYITIIVTAIIIDFLFTGFKPISVSNYEFEKAILEKNGVATIISNQFALLKPIMNTILNYNNIEGAKNLTIYILESLSIYIVGLFIISKVYLKGAIGTTINSKKAKKENKKLTINDFKQEKANKAYLKKELRTILRTPIFCIQCIIIPLIYPLIILSVLIIAIILSKNMGVNITEKLLEIINTSSGQAIFLGVAQVFFMMNFCSIIGISKDSKTAILTKTLPMELNNQFDIKTKIGKRINLLSTVIVTFAYYYTVQNINASIIVFSILYLMNSIGENIKLLIDIKKPQINWNSEYTMMKQNTNVMNVLFYTLAVLMGLLVISKIIKKANIFLVTLLIISLVAYLAITNYINKNQNKIFRKIY